MAAQKRPAFRLKGLKFQIEIDELEIDSSGDESAAPQLKGMFADKLAQAIEPVTRGLLPGVDVTPPAATLVAVETDARPRRPARRRAANMPVAEALPDWKPDIQKYGNPTNEWNTGDRAMWLLGCYAKDHALDASAPKGLSQPAIRDLFGKHFSHLRQINYSDLKRDMGKLASAERPKIQVDRTKTPAIWSLTDAGTAYVDEMIKRATAPVLTGVA